MTSSDFPYLSIRVSIRNWDVLCEALIDTGFSGDLVVPADAPPQNIGDPDHVRIYRVADDRITRAPVFVGELEIPEIPPVPDIAVTALGSKYIIGLGIIERYVVTLERGERVIIES